MGQFALTDYTQAVRWAGAMTTYTQRRQMPPWGADSHGEFNDERRLSDWDLHVLKSWSEGGVPEGKKADLPPLPVFAEGWELGKPDAVFRMVESYTVPAEAKDEYRCFVIPSGITEEKWISGIAFQAGSAAVVHHVTAFYDTTGTARKMDAADPKPGYLNPTPANGPGFSEYGILGGWSPGHTPRRLPNGVGNRMPKDADIVLEVHYHSVGVAQTDRSQFALYYVPGAVEKPLKLGGVGTKDYTIPAGAKNQVVEAYTFVEQDITLLGVTPHMHFLGKEMTVTATLPDGSARRLVSVPRWDFRWQFSYRFKVPVKLPKGTRIDLRAVYDNSAENPDNPYKPPREVKDGATTRDEMCVAFLAYTLDGETVKPGKR